MTEYALQIATTPTYSYLVSYTLDLLNVQFAMVIAFISNRNALYR